METLGNKDHNFKAPKAKKDIERGVLLCGTIKVGGKKYPWEVVPSRRSSVSNGAHLTLVSESEGPLPASVRSRLTMKAENVADFLSRQVAAFNWFTRGETKLGYRLDTNMGDAATIKNGYHAHIIIPGEGDILPRVVANTKRTIDGLLAPETLKNDLRRDLLQGYSS